VHARERQRAASVSKKRARPRLHARDAQVWEMHKLLAEGMRSGEVEPLPWTVFARAKTQDAFRYLASGARAAPPGPRAGACARVQCMVREVGAHGVLHWHWQQHANRLLRCVAGGAQGVCFLRRLAFCGAPAPAAPSPVSQH